MSQKLAAEFIGTFWLVLGGCGSAVLAATLTTIVVFIPILLIEEEAGQLFRDIALAICAAVGLSLIVSVTVIPT